MARRMRLTDGDVVALFDSSSDELDLEQSDEDIVFEPDLTENLSESSSSHELSFSDDGDMEADSVDASTNVGGMDVDIGNACSYAESDINVSDFTTSNSVWSPYAPTDSNLLKLPFTVNNPGIRLPTSGQYENELIFNCINILPTVLSLSLFMKQKGMQKKKWKKLNCWANV